MDWFLYDIGLRHESDKEISEKSIDYINQLFKGNGGLKHLKDFKKEFCLHYNFLYKWPQLIPTLPRNLKDILKQNLNIFLDLMSLNKNQSCSKSGKIRFKRAL